MAQRQLVGCSFYDMTKQINIEKIDYLSKPLYVLTVGGMAVGKSFVVSRFIKTIPVMDVDDIMKQLKYVDYSRAHFSKAMKLIAEKIKTAMDNKESIIAMGTSSDLSFSIDKLFNAKMNGYTTVLLFIDASYEQAVRQNEERKEKGERAVAAEKGYRIRQTNTGSANTYAILKDTNLVDFCVHYVNLRTF